MLTKLQLSLAHINPDHTTKQSSVVCSSLFCQCFYCGVWCLLSVYSLSIRNPKADNTNTLWLMWISGWSNQPGISKTVNKPQKPQLEMYCPLLFLQAGILTHRGPVASLSCTDWVAPESLQVCPFSGFHQSLPSVHKNTKSMRHTADRMKYTEGLQTFATQCQCRPRVCIMHSVLS